ncbi:MAG: radical SAM protein [bacterium]|nr:radical SAM protein [bacterium]
MGIRHRFRVDERYYVLDAVSSQLLELPRDTYDRLPEWELHWQRGLSVGPDRGPGCAAFAELDDACDKGLLSDCPPELVNPIAHPSLNGAWCQSTSALSLCMTEHCNLRCSYCPYTANIGSRRKHSRVRLPESVARQAVRLLRETLDESETPVIGFYGGEPLLNQSLVRSITRFARESFAPQTVTFNITTNGTVMNEGIARFLIENDMQLLVSLDGPQELHDRYRVNPLGEGTYKRIIKTLSLLKHASPEYFSRRVRLNIVLAPPLDTDGINEYLRTELPVSLQHCSVTLVDGSDTEFLQEHPFTSEDEAGTRFLRRRAEQAFISGEWSEDPLALLLFEKSLLRLAFRNGRNVSGLRFIPTGQCLPGGHKLYVGVNGDLHMCERIDEGCSIGDVDRGLQTRHVKRVLGPFFDYALKNCGQCCALRLCGVCMESAAVQGRFDEQRMRSACEEARWRLQNDLVSYVRIVRQNPKAFEKFAPLEPQKSFLDVLSY